MQVLMSLLWLDKTLSQCVWDTERNNKDEDDEKKWLKPMALACQENQSMWSVDVSVKGWCTPLGTCYNYVGTIFFSHPKAGKKPQSI